MKNKIKIKIFLIVNLIIFSFAIKAQDLTNYNLYNQNPFLYNPAYSADVCKLNAFLNSHLQWSGFDGAPKVSTLGARANLAENMGAGIQVFNYNSGVIITTDINLNYAYKLKFETDHFLHAGLGLGVISDYLNVTDISAANTADPLLTTDNTRTTTLNAKFGLAYKFRKIEAQLIMPQLYQRKGLNLYTIGILAYNYDLNSSISLKPSAMYRGKNTTKNQFDVNLMATYNKMIWAQVGYRSNNSFIGSVGFNLNNIAIGYAYQTESNIINQAGGGTHEIQLIYKMGCNENDNTQPFLSGYVTNSFDKTPIENAELVISDEDNKELYKIKTDKKGYYDAKLKLGKSYKISAKAPKYADKNELVAINKEDINKNFDIQLKPLSNYLNGKTVPSVSNVKITDEKGIVVYTGVSDNSGNYKVELEPCKKYTIEVSVNGYVTKTEEITMSCDKMEYSKETRLIANYDLNGKVKNKQTGDLVNVDLKITDESGKVVEQKSISGSFSLPLIEGKYTIEVSGKDFITKKETIVLKKDTEKEILVTPMTGDNTFSLGSVNFETGKSIVKDQDSYDILNELVKIMEENPGFNVEIQGHTDDVGNADANLKLSQDRADVCRNYAISKGISADRITAKGYGETKPIVPNNSTENRAKNRRTEFKIIE